MFSSGAINRTDIWGDVFLSPHQQMLYLQWLHLNSTTTLVLGVEGKPNYFVLSQMFSFPFLSY
jgi:hypothetical protein